MFLNISFGNFIYYNLFINSSARIAPRQVDTRRRGRQYIPELNDRLRQQENLKFTKIPVTNEPH